MLKTVSSITNAIGALNFKGTWDANANSPVLASSVGTKGDYYVVGTAGATNLNGISNWGVGDLATFNGSVWQRVEGGADLNGVNLSVSGTSTLSGLTASTALALNASKEVVSVTNTGTGNNVLATSPTFVTPVLGVASATSLTTPIFLGTQYALTSFSGTTAIVDTGIVAVVETASTAQMYQVDIKVNLSPGGPGGRRAVASYLVGVGVGSSVDISQTLLHRTGQAGIGDVTLTSTFWDGSTEAASFASGGPWQIRLKLDTIYANPSASLQCRITQLTP